MASNRKRNKNEMKTVIFILNRLHQVLDEYKKYCLKIKSFKTIKHNIREMWLNLSGYQDFVDELTTNSKITHDIYEVMLANTIEVYGKENLLRHVENNMKEVTCKKFFLLIKLISLSIHEKNFDKLV